MTGADNPFSVTSLRIEETNPNNIVDDLNESLQSLETDSFLTDVEDEEEGNFNDFDLSEVFNHSELYTSTPLSHYEFGENISNLDRVKKRLFTSTESDEVNIFKVEL